MVRDACYILDMPEVPELYVRQDPTPNAMALGSDHPFIVLNTGLIDLLDDEELRFVIGHEVGHILSGHAVYQTMMQIRCRSGRGWRGCRSATSASRRSSSGCASGSGRRSCRPTGRGCSPGRTWTRRSGST